MYYGETGSKITHAILIEALTRLGDLLNEEQKTLELVCCGGVVSVLYHRSRQITHDVDVIFPDSPEVTAILKKLVDKVGEEFDLEHGPRDKWFNDSVSFIGLETKSQTVVFRHSNLVLKAAEWHEMLAHKLTAFRGERDIDDAVHFLKEINSSDPSAILALVFKYRPFVPATPDSLFERRFQQVWKRAYG